MLDDIEKLLYFRKWYDDPATFFVDIYREPYDIEEAFPYQANIMRMLKDPSINRLLILAAGTTGKTITLGGAALWNSVVLAKILKKRQDTIIISGSDEQSRSLYDYSKTVLETHPVLNDEVLGDIRVSRTMFKDRSTIMALPNSVKAIQGKHAPFVIVDEAALAGDFVINDTKRIIGSFEPNRVILSGTPMGFEQGATGELFIEMFENKEKYPNWKRISWSAFDCPGISDEMRKDASSLPENLYQIYWLGKPYVSVKIMIPREAIKVATEDEEGNDLEIIPYNKTYKVYCGIDWGHAHATVVVFVQINENDEFEVVELGYFKGDTFEKIHDWIEDRSKFYKPTKIFTDGSDVGENQRLQERGLPVYPIQFNREKGYMQSRLRDLFIKKKIKISKNEQKLIQELRSYTWDKKLNDDTVDALQLAVREECKPLSNIYYKIIRSR